MVTPPGNESGGVSTSRYQTIAVTAAVTMRSATLSTAQSRTAILSSVCGSSAAMMVTTVVRSDHIQSGGDHSNPSHLTGEYDDSLDEVPEHRPSPFSATAAERRTGD